MLYSQGGRVDIYIHKDRGGGGNGTNTNGGKGNRTQTADKKVKNPNWKRDRFIRVNASHAFAVGMQVTKQWTDYAVSWNGYKNGDQSLQQSTQRTVEILGDVSSFASSVGMGITYGAAGGPLGSAIGAALGAVSSISSIGIKYATRDKEQAIREFKLENGIAYKRARANINLTTGRLR